MFRARYHPSSGVTELYTFRYRNGSQRSPKRDVEEIKWRLARQYYARVGDVKRVERGLVSRCNRNVYSSVTPDDG